jgi:hypothetical protein
MSDKMIFSVPYFLRSSLANPVPSCPRPPVKNNINIVTIDLEPVRIKYKIYNITKIQNVLYSILYFTIG